jgi:para-nitrobenzyl esterase
MELAFMFNNVGLQPEMNGATKEAFALSDKMSSAWIAFIKTGNPNTKGLPRWEAYNADSKPTMIFDNKCYLRK